MTNFWKDENMIFLNGRYIRFFGQKNGRKMAKTIKKLMIFWQKNGNLTVSKNSLYA